MSKRILSLLCAMALVLGMITVPAFAAEEATDSTAQNVTVLSKDEENLTFEGDAYIDLNGFSIAGVTVTGGTLYVSDSKTDDYTVSDGVYGTVTGITGDVQAAENYVAIKSEGAVSYHKVDLSLKSMSLRPAAAGVYYNSSFAADEVVAANVECYGVALSVAAEPTELNLESLCGYSVIPGFASGEKSGTLLTGIMEEANTAEKNAENAAMPVYGRAYIKTSEGYTFGACVSRDLKTQVEAIDAVFNALTDTQKSGILAMYETYKAAMESWNIPNLRASQLGDTVITVPVQTENGVVTESVTVEENGMSITVPFGALVEKSELTLKVTKKEQSDSGIEAEDDQTLMPFDVHVEGISAENTVPLTVELGRVMPENLNMGNYTVYHVEETGTNAMELVAVGAEFTAHNQYKYTLDGELTLHMATFSEVAIVSEEPKWEGTRNYDWYKADATELEIRNADQLAGLSAIVGGMDGQTQDSFAGKTVKLLADINIGDLDSENGIVFYPIGYNSDDGKYEKTGVAVSTGFYAFMGTFDGNGNTISNFYQNTWEMKGDHNWYDATLQYYRDGMGLFGKVYGGTVKNLTVDNFSCDGEIATTGVIAAYADCGATFENIAITNCNPRVYNIGNGGIVGCAGWYAKEASVGDPITFKNITVDQSNMISALWGTYDVSCGGILGQYYPNSGQDGSPKNGGIKMENCHVAAIMDVNNDVCANYQYYWYRYSGMLIGTIRANTTDSAGYTVADTTDIEVKDCTYTLGEWNEYWYCELVKNSLASYTHDHQFSRLTTIDALTDIATVDAEGNVTAWLQEGNFVIPNEDNTAATCYHIFKNSKGNLYQHFHNVADETNPNIYETFDLNGDGELNDLKEDRQCYFMPFNQVFNGLGYGVKPTYEFEGIENTTGNDGAFVKSEEKFTALKEENYTITTGTTMRVAELFALQEGVKISEPTIHVFVSPVGEESTVEAKYVCVSDGYFANIPDLTFTGIGAAKITITDYYFCKATVLNVTVAEPESVTKFQPTELTTVNAGEEIALGELFTAVNGAEIDSSTVTISVDGGESEFTPNTSDWTQATIKFTNASVYDVVIKDGNYCNETATQITAQLVEKFTANTVSAQNAYTQIALGELFAAKGGATIGNVTATVTDPNGNETPVTGTSSEWATQAINLTKDGTWTVTIKDDDDYCAITETTFTVNKADKFTKKFDKDFLYRIGNANTAEIGYLFGEIETAVKLSAVNVTIENVAGDAAGIFTSNATWTSGTLKFTGTGVVKVTISADGANAVELYLEVVKATNITGSNTTLSDGTVVKQISSLGSGNVVLLNDVNLNSGGALSISGASLYGNGFEIDVTRGKNTGGSSSNNYLLNLASSTLDNVRIVGEVYTQYGGQVSDAYNNPVVRASGTCKIMNSYIANCSAPIRVTGGHLEVINTTLKGGNFANIDIRNGQVVLEDVTTINQALGNDKATDGSSVIGLGVVIYYENVASDTTVEIKGTLTQYNNISDNDKFTNDYATQLVTAMLGSGYTDLQLESDGVTWANAGVVCMSEGMLNSIIDNRENKGNYVQKEATFVSTDGWVYTAKPTESSIITSPASYESTTQGAIDPGYYLDSDAVNYAEKVDGGTEYCYVDDSDVVQIGVTKGETFNWDPFVLYDSEKNKLSGYTVQLDGQNVTESVGFNESGTYVLTYSYDYSDNYRLDANGNVESYTKTYTKTLKVVVSVLAPAVEYATFTFGSSNQATEKVTINNNTYISATGVSDDNSSWAYITVGSQKIYYPIVEATIVSKKNAYFNIFKNVVAITDGDTTYSGDTTSDSSSLPTNLVVTNGKYGAFADISSDWSTLNDSNLNFDTSKYTGANMGGKVFSYAAADGTYASVTNYSSALCYKSPELTNARDEYYTIAKFAYTDSNNATFYYYVGYHMEAKGKACVTGDTLVTLADGTQKRIDQVTYEDRLLVWDFYTGEYTTMPSSHLVNHGYADNTIIHLNFADGTVVKAVNEHAFFDVDTNEFALLSAENIADYVGHRFAKQDGTTTVLETYSIEEKYIEAYSILSVKHYNCYLEGMLSLTPPEASGNYFMPFEVGENMTFDAEKMQADIEKYGLFTYEEFADRVSEEVFYALNAPQVKVAIGKGIITMEEFEAIVDALADKDFAD